MSEIIYDFPARQSPYSLPQNIALLRHYADDGGGPAPVVRVLNPGDGFDGAMELVARHRARVVIIADTAKQANLYAHRAVALLCGYRRHFSEDS